MDQQNQIHVFRQRWINFESLLREQALLPHILARIYDARRPPVIVWARCP